MIRRFCKLAAHALPPRGYSWSPADFGQARMAALGWLVSLAEQEQPGPAGRCHRGASRGRPRKHRAIFTRSGTGSISASCATTTPARSRPASEIERGRAERSAGALGLSAALGARKTPLGQRSRAHRRSRQRDRRTPRRSKDRSRSRVACYRELRARRPELAQARDHPERRQRAELGQASRRRGTVLSRSRRQAQRRSARLPARSTWRPTGATSTVLIQLFERYDRLQTGRSTPYYSTGSFYFQRPGAGDRARE